MKPWILLFLLSSSFDTIAQNVLNAYSGQNVQIKVHLKPNDMLTGESFSTVSVKNTSPTKITSITFNITCDCSKGPENKTLQYLRNIEPNETKMGYSNMDLVFCMGLPTSCSVEITEILFDNQSINTSTTTNSSTNNTSGSFNSSNSYTNKANSTYTGRHDNQPKYTPEQVRQQRIQQQMAAQRKQQDELRRAQQSSSSSTTTRTNTNYNSSSSSNNSSSSYQQQQQRNQAMVAAEIARQQAYTKAAADLTTLTTTVANHYAAQAKRNEEKRERERLIENERKARETANRKELERMKSLKNNYIKGLSTYGFEWPTSSSSISTAKLYYYITSYLSSGTIKTIHFTTIFSIDKRDDGSWPYSSDVLNDVKKKDGWQNNKMQIQGYFTNYSAASKHQLLNVQNGQLNGLKVVKVAYLLNQSASSGTDAFDNPWGTPKKPSKSVPKKTNADKKFDDPWGSTTKTKKKKN